MEAISINDLNDFYIGNCENCSAGTGCTVIVSREGAVGGVDVRGGAPGTRETDLLNPMNLVEKINSVFLSGGSAFGLDCAGGIMKYLEDENCGFNVGVTKVPIVTGAVLFDLNIGNAFIRPDFLMGYEAAQNSKIRNYKDGMYGAGTGASVGKIKGNSFAMKSGQGSYAVKVGDLYVGAVVAVNCFGDVFDPESNSIIAGAFSKEKRKFLDTEMIMIENCKNNSNTFAGNTTIGVVITNAILNKSQSNKIASMAHNGYARTLRPAHSMFDGDTIFCMASGKVDVDVNVVGILAQKVIEKAVVKAVKSAKSAFGLFAYEDISEMLR